ncbi:carboxymuconolactone decarboxylase family protein [Halopseudomonas salegens]|uniref:Alkylhydroperoxidase AhpD family core domain-containing protein n=1 Tax=Halopseudomonas salegens TaxID=1434072 RepID=A0A1H2DZA2_9GAMM|nr:carboxymuconolactone decarboxylase family protein [Halopseudomonas salegens]SDT88117.1 alkylhydroperoxidase AhpD family core domain-containing protein [Halopseudomonas salegens]
MSEFTLYTLETAPKDSKPLLEDAKKSMGSIPNLFAVMADAPSVLEAYLTLNRLFTQSSFNANEQTVLWQTINAEHECTYCVAAHTAIAKQMKVSDEITQALRDGKPLADKKLQVLRDFALEVVRERGFVKPASLQAFLDAGYSHQQVQEVVLCLSQKVLSNYINHMAETPLDEGFAAFEWSPGDKQ